MSASIMFRNEMNANIWFGNKVSTNIRVGNEGMKTLAERLKTNTSLTKLGFNYINVTVFVAI